MKLKCASFSVRTRSVTMSTAVRFSHDLAHIAKGLLDKELPITLRLIGVRVAQLVAASANLTSNTMKPKRQQKLDNFTLVKEKDMDRILSAGESDVNALHSGDEVYQMNASVCCPICAKTVNADDNIALNAHIDKCISKRDSRQINDYDQEIGIRAKRRRITDYFELNK